MRVSPGIAVCIVPLLPSAALAQADPYPSKLVRWVLPFSAGSGQDILGRSVAPKLAERLGQPIVVENKAGAGGLIGFDYMAKAAPDGYQIMMANNSLLILSALRPTPYDPVKDFAPVTVMGYAYSMIMVHPSVPANSLSELIAYSKANPGKLNYASPAVGTFGHLSTELFRLKTGADFVHIPHKGITGAVQGLVTGDVGVLFGGESVALPHIKAGKVKVLAAAGQRRSFMFPDVPSVGELGVKDYDPVLWYGLTVPPGTSAPIVARLNQEMARILGDAGMRQELMNRGIEPAAGTPDQLGTLMRTEYETWKQVIKAGNIKAD
jgi:tripartite-type tricarboxylate transporter receptor subunit TctC